MEDKIHVSEKDIENYVCGKRKYIPAISDHEPSNGARVLYSPVASYACDVMDVMRLGKISILTVENLREMHANHTGTETHR